MPPDTRHRLALPQDLLPLSQLPVDPRLNLDELLPRKHWVVLKLVEALHQHDILERVHPIRRTHRSHNEARKGIRRHLSQDSRQLLAKFFKVHPGYLVSDPPGYHTELTSDVATVETALDRWLGDGATRFAHDPALGAALERVALHAESRRCLVLLGEMISMPGLIDRLSQTLVPEEQK